MEPVDPRVRLAIAQWPPKAPRGSVTTFCLEHEISRKTFYAIRNRALSEGQAAALEPRSRRPRASPTRIEAEVVRAAVGVRAALDEAVVCRLRARQNAVNRERRLVLLREPGGHGLAFEHCNRVAAVQ